MDQLAGKKRSYGSPVRAGCCVGADRRGDRHGVPFGGPRRGDRPVGVIVHVELITGFCAYPRINGVGLGSVTLDVGGSADVGTEEDISVAVGLVVVGVPHAVAHGLFAVALTSVITRRHEMRVLAAGVNAVVLEDVHQLIGHWRKVVVAY